MQRLIAPRNPLELDGALLDPHWVVATLEAHLTPDRIKRIERVLDGRTHNFATVVEGLQDTGNMAAIMRSADSSSIDTGTVGPKVPPASMHVVLQFGAELVSEAAVPGPPIATRRKAAAPRATMGLRKRRVVDEPLDMGFLL